MKFIAIPENCWCFGPLPAAQTSMEVTKANTWAADLARYIKAHPPKRNTALRARIKALTHGEGLDDNDLDQLERKVRRLIFPVRV